MLNPGYKRSKSGKNRSKTRMSKGSVRNVDGMEEAKAHYPRISSPTSTFHLTTKGELDKRESDEVCVKHGGNIVAYEEKTGQTLCETCVYKGSVERPVFTATVAKGIKKAFTREHEEFQKLVNEFMQIDQKQVKERIQMSVFKYFNMFREKIDELEKKTVNLINNSKNLSELIASLDDIQSYLEDEKVIEKYDGEKTKIDTKISTMRYTYVCQRRKEFDDIIDNLKKDNANMASNIAKARSMIDSIFDVREDEPQIENILNTLASEFLRIDDKKPDFGSIVTKQEDSDSVEKHLDLLPSRIKVAANKPEKPDYLSDQMNSFYFTKDNHLWVKEIDGEIITESEVMPLKLFLQKVITVPFEAENKVFLLGGTKDVEGKQAVDNWYEVNFENKSLIPVSKLSVPTVSMAGGISPDCKHIIIAGGSEGENRPTNNSEIFDVNVRKWNKLPTLNCPRMSASLIVCTNENVFCFGGIESDPNDPSKFLPLRSIEWLDYGDADGQWETLRIKTPSKGSSMGAICMGDREFLIFGGWNRKTLNKSAYVWFTEKQGYCTEDGPDLAEPDTFVSSGLMLRNIKKRECIFFGVSHNHIYNEKSEQFSIFGNPS